MKWHSICARPTHIHSYTSHHHISCNTTCNVNSLEIIVLLCRLRNNDNKVYLRCAGAVFFSSCFHDVISWVQRANCVLHLLQSSQLKLHQSTLDSDLSSWEGLQRLLLLEGKESRSSIPHLQLSACLTSRVSVSVTRKWSWEFRPDFSEWNRCCGLLMLIEKYTHNRLPNLPIKLLFIKRS